MNWLLLLHIAAMLFWCGSLLYMPALIFEAATPKNRVDVDIKKQVAIPRMIFTLVLTPAALITIISGTLVFIVMKTVSLWLVLKLTLVMGLVICHTLNGWLILKAEKTPSPHFKTLCTLIGSLSAMLITAIIWVVLAKPYGAIV